MFFLYNILDTFSITKLLNNIFLILEMYNIEIWKLYIWELKNKKENRIPRKEGYLWLVQVQGRVKRIQYLPWVTRIWIWADMWPRFLSNYRLRKTIYQSVAFSYGQSWIPGVHRIIHTRQSGIQILSYRLSWYF